MSGPGGLPDSVLISGLLTLSEVTCTGYHAALAGRVTSGSNGAGVRREMQCLMGIGLTPTREGAPGGQNGSRKSWGSGTVGDLQN